MELRYVVMKLIGPVQPYGDHYADKQRLANMKELTELTDYLLGEIDQAAASSERQESSMKAIGQHAKEFLDDVRSAS